MNTTRKVGTFILVEVNKNVLIGDLCYHKSDKERQIYLNNNTAIAQVSYQKVEPIIICDDKVKDGEQGYFPYSKTIHICNDEKGIHPNMKKILVSSTQFSPEFLQAIVDVKVKDGDKVEVEMERTNLEEPDSYALYGKIKLRKDDTAIIHPYTETVEEAAKKWLLDHTNVEVSRLDAFKAGAEWQKNQK